MKSKVDPRHTARKVALSSLFCWLFTEPHEDACNSLAKELLEIPLETENQELTDFIVEGVKQNIKEIDDIIRKAAPEWPIDKISKVDLIILRISIFEVVFGKKTPVKVAIDEAVELIEVLKSTGETTDDELANKTGIRLNSIRKILYKLYNHSIVNLRRTRDPKTGWFIFHWKLQLDQLEGLILSQKLRVLEKLNMRLEYEKTHDFYYCQTPGCKRIPFEDAVEQLFRCPTCGKPVTHYDNENIVEILKQKIQQLQEELSA